MWGEAVRTAVYLMNRSPVNTLDVTPAELWLQKRPNLSNLQLFGCVGYSKVLGRLKKLDARSVKLYFVGYAPHGYRLWNTDTRKIEVARDVRFSESDIVVLDIVRVNFESDENQSEEEEKENLAEEEEIENLAQPEDQSEDEELVTRQIGEVKEPEVVVVDRAKRKIQIPKKFENFVLMTYEQAVTDDGSEKWKLAIEEEKIR